MVRHYLQFLFMALVCLGLSKKVSSKADQYRERVFVSMRMIGHELLLASGDSTSRILPVTKEGNRYKIQFATSFSFEPQLLSTIVDSILNESRIAAGYLVEVEDCDSGNVVYSYEVGVINKGNFIPCQGRPQPKGCYVILLRIITPVNTFDSLSTDAGFAGGATVTNNSRSIYKTGILYYFFTGLVISLFIILRIKKRSLKKGSHKIRIGSYVFDHKNMVLVKGNEKQDLTGKETDLLQLLYLHLNSTVDRDIILKEVWRDEGAYIGRTLDVYISKLRKKFESDPAISIINVRGIGYKMTLD